MNIFGKLLIAIGLLVMLLSIPAFYGYHNYNEQLVTSGGSSGNFAYHSIGYALQDHKTENFKMLAAGAIVGGFGLVFLTIGKQEDDKKTPKPPRTLFSK